MIPAVPTIITLVQANDYAADQLSTSNGVDCSTLDGFAVAHLSVNAISGTTPTLDVKLQECDTVGGSYSDVAGGAFTQVTTVDGDQQLIIEISKCKKFVAMLVDVGGTTPHYGIYGCIIGQKKYD